MITSTAEEVRRIGQLKQRLKNIEVIENDTNLAQHDETLLRFLRARDLNLDNAEKLFCTSMAWRKQIKPLQLNCKTCLDHPGAHSLRIIGFDLMYRPVIYSSFTQASLVKVTASDVIEHLIYTMENAIRLMISGVYQWILILDCSGMSITSCNPKLGYECTQMLSEHYPERLAHALCLRPTATFKTALIAMRKFMPSATAKKIHLIKCGNEKNFAKQLTTYFDKSLIDWLMKEVKLNGKKYITNEQKQFWSYNNQAKHDPRGSSTYLDECLFIRKDKAKHMPHPNILQALNGKELKWMRSMDDEAVLKEFQNDEDDDEDIDVEDDKLNVEFIQSLTSDMQIVPKPKELSVIQSTTNK